MHQHKADTLQSLTGSDPIYQELLRSCLDLESEYVRIQNTLPEKDRILLDRYISLCEELDHRKLFLVLTIL